MDPRSSSLYSQNPVSDRLVNRVHIFKTGISKIISNIISLSTYKSHNGHFLQGSATKILYVYHVSLKRDSSASIGTRLRTGGPRFNFRQMQGFFSSSPHPDRHWDLPSPLENGYRGYCKRGNEPSDSIKGREYLA
jgi:hypothetical protein